MFSAGAILCFRCSGLTFRKHSDPNLIWGGGGEGRRRRKKEVHCDASEHHLLRSSTCGTTIPSYDMSDQTRLLSEGRGGKRGLVFPGQQGRGKKSFVVACVYTSVRA